MLNVIRFGVDFSSCLGLVMSQGALDCNWNLACLQGGYKQRVKAS